MFSIAISAALLLIIIELVRRRKLAEEYSALWILTGVVVLVLVVWTDLLMFITRVIGAVSATTTLFLFGIVFLMIINLHYSMKITKLSDRVRYLAQKMTIEVKKD
jgi:hypothetical protein